MTNYTMFQNLTSISVGPTTTQGGTPPANVPSGCQAVAPGGGAANTVQPTAGQEFQVNVTGSGVVTAIVQPFRSNDGINWATLGSTITATGPAGIGVTLVSTTDFATWYMATLTSITGTGASATCIMST